MELTVFFTKQALLLLKNVQLQKLNTAFYFLTYY